MVELLEKTVEEKPQQRNSLVWNRSLYREIEKSVTIYYNSHLYEMNKYHIDREDLVQKVAFTLYRWKDFDPQKYKKKVSDYISYIVGQKISKDKKTYFRFRKNISVSLDEEFNNQSSKDSNEVTIGDTIADSSYRFLEFMEDCLSRIPEDHKFYIEDISFNTKEVFRLLFSGWSGEEIAYAANIDGKKFRKMKRILTKEFYSSDKEIIYEALPSNITFRADYYLPYSKEETIANQKAEEDLQASLSGEVKIIYN